jgi:D-alanine--poly(phosphoribitol) ligase subunit 2
MDGGSGVDADGVEARVLEILEEVAETDAVTRDGSLPLYDSGLLDSLGTVSIMAALEQAFGLTVSPAEFDPAAWATPDLLVADVRRRLAAGSGR